jgi:hypothetical protein
MINVRRITSFLAMTLRKKNKTSKIAPIEMEILFCASEASAKKIEMESGINLEKMQNRLAPNSERS